MRLAGIVAVLGCGRVAFEPLAGGDGGDGAAGDVPLPATCAPFTNGWVLDPAAPIASLASTANDSKPFLLADGLTLYFISDRAGNDDVWVATRPTQGAAFAAPERSAELSSPASESGISITDDGQLAFISSNRGGSQQHDLWVSTFSGGTLGFGPPVLITGGANTASWEYEPTPTPTGDRLFYVTENYADYPGGGDPVIAVRASTTSYGSPSLFAALATSNNEYGFSVSRDERVAMVASDRDGPGTTSYIFVSYRATTSVAFPPGTRMSQLEVSTDQGHATLSADGCEIWFGALMGGRYQLYVARWRQL